MAAMNVFPNSNEQKYFFTVVANDIYTTTGDILPPVQIQFQTTADQAQGELFGKGYNLVSQNGLFLDNKERFVSEEFATTKEGVSYEDTAPDRLNVLFETSPFLNGPFAGFPFENMRFKKLSIHRIITPTQGGSRSRRGYRSRRGGSRGGSRGRRRRTYRK
jgi:hypothetical protein